MKASWDRISRRFASEQAGAESLESIRQTAIDDADVRTKRMRMIALVSRRSAALSPTEMQKEKGIENANANVRTIGPWGSRCRVRHRGGGVAKNQQRRRDLGGAHAQVGVTSPPKTPRAAMIYRPWLARKARVWLPKVGGEGTKEVGWQIGASPADPAVVAPSRTMPMRTSTTGAAAASAP
jgi:hypothetical protein